MKRRKNKPKVQYMKTVVAIVLTFSLLVVLATLIANFVLLWNGKQPMTEETVAAITTFGGVASGVALAAYSALTAVRNWSQNKHLKGAKPETNKPVK